MPYRKKNGLAVSSLILGLVSFILGGPLTAIPGVITGHMARTRVRNFPDRYLGYGIALIGLILNYFVLALFILAMMIVAYWYSTGELNEIFQTGMQQMEQLRLLL